MQLISRMNRFLITRGLILIFAFIHIGSVMSISSIRVPMNSIFLVFIPTPTVRSMNPLIDTFHRRYTRQIGSSDHGSVSSTSHVAYGTSKVTGDCIGRDDESLCDPMQGGVCKNQTCISACHSTRYSPRLQPCICASEDDSFCYLCCGSSSQVCAPAHEYHIFKPNGEYWERQVCSRCRTHPNGLACDERNARRVCHNGKCVSSICHGKSEGSLCTLDLSRICVDDECRDPCKEHDPLLRMCDCDVYSEDRCELCCHDRRTKKCENAYEKYKIKNHDARMILRVGLTCRRGLTCNKYGACRASGLHASVIVWILIMISPFYMRY